MFPKRTANQVAEAKSLAILREVLPDQWIFRHESADDYGIDVEIELVDRQGNVSGHFFKAQVKSTQEVTFRQDQKATVSNIKQSTLMYWCSLSQYIHVVAFLVDLSNRKVYWTPVFWQAAELISGGDSTKTIEFGDRPLNDEAGLVSLVAYILSPTVSRTLDAHVSVLRSLPSFFSLFTRCCYSDHWLTMDHTEEETLKSLISNAHVLCWRDAFVNHDMYDVSHWRRESERTFGDNVAYATGFEALKHILPVLVNRLRQLQASIGRGKTYWAAVHKDYYELVTSTKLPEESDIRSLMAWIEANIPD